MKRAVKGLVLLVGFAVALLVVCAVRAVLVGRAAPSAPPTPAAITAGPADSAALRRFSEAIRIPTVTEFGKPANLPEFRRMHAFLARSYPRVHATLRREFVDSGSLLFTWRGSDTSLAPVVFMGHMDVVPVEPGTEKDWTHPAFAGAMADGFIWGRGALDDKMSVMGLLEATESLLASGHHPRRTVIFSFGHTEEGGSAANAARHAVDLLESRGIKPWFVMDEGGAVGEGLMPGVAGRIGLIGIAEKGYLSLRLTAKAEGGHSSVPPKETAVSILAEAVAEVQETPLPARLDGAVLKTLAAVTPLMSFRARMVMANLWLFGPVVTRLAGGNKQANAMVRTTTAATMIDGGVKDNVVPQSATAIVNFRLLPGDSVAWVIARVKAMIDDERVTVEPAAGAGVEASRVSPDGEAFNLIAAAVRETFGTSVVTPYLLMGGTDARNFERISPNVYRFAPALVTGTTLSLVHGTNERVGVDNYLSGIAFFKRIVASASK